MMILKPRVQYLLAEFRINEDEAVTKILNESGLALITYEQRWGLYRMRLSPGDQKEYCEQLDLLIKRAHEQYHS